MPLTDLWRLKDGKLIEPWDDSLYWKYSSKSPQRRLERRKGNEPLDVAVISGWDSKHGSCVRHGHVLFDDRPSRSQIGFTICGHRNHGFFPLVRRRADADLGRLGDLVQLLAGRIQQRWAALVLSRVASNAGSVRRSLQSLVKTNQSDSDRSGKNRRKTRQRSRPSSVVG